MNTVRTCDLSELNAICEHESGMCHRYSVAQTSSRYVTLTYSNPNEYGTDQPIACKLPIIERMRATLGMSDADRLVIVALTVPADTRIVGWSAAGMFDDDEAFQAFSPILDHPGMSYDCDKRGWSTTTIAKTK